MQINQIINTITKAEEYKKLFPGESPYTPLAVGCEIDNICNADCSFCGYGKGADGRKKQFLNIKVLRHTLKLFSDAGGGGFTISPILGEVSTDKRWLDMVKMARSYPNITGVSCYTNALRLHHFGMEKILTSGLSNMTLSTALGSKEQYKRLYGVNRYEQVVKNILDLLKKNQELGEPVFLTLALRIDKPFSKFYESNLYKEIVEYLPPERISILDDGWDNYGGLVGKEDIPEGHVFHPMDSDTTTPCYALYRKLEVLTDGTIQACACRVEPELQTENIMDFQTLDEAWRNKGLEKIRENWDNGILSECCKKCDHYIPWDRYGYWAVQEFKILKIFRDYIPFRSYIFMSNILSLCLKIVFHLFKR